MALVRMSLQLVVVLLSITASFGKVPFGNQIPNGHLVPHPCQPGATWLGVGHTTAAGAGDKNPFGWDFFDNSMVWSTALCNKDSDLDGLTNGQELGDPGCVWTVGQTPTSDAKGHPGICEPTHLVSCQQINNNYFIVCQ